MIWDNVILKSGKIISFYRQDDRGDCAPACVYIVLKLTGKPVGMAQLRDYARRMDHQQYGMELSRDWLTEGTDVSSVHLILKRFLHKYICCRHITDHSEFKSFCESRSARNPAIIQVQFEEGGPQHSVVTIGKDGHPARTSIEILDPDFGHQELPMDQFPQYNPVRYDGTRAYSVILCAGIVETGG